MYKIQKVTKYQFIHFQAILNLCYWLEYFQLEVIDFYDSQDQNYRCLEKTATDILANIVFGKLHS